MYIVHVFIHVKPDSLEAFKKATLANVQNSRDEAGVERFDFLAYSDDPHRFMLIEVYHSPEAAAEHKETAHYQVWRDAVAPMMAEPRSSIKLSEILP